MLVDFDEEELGFIREAVSVITQSASVRIRILDKIREAEENVGCGNCKNGFCKRSLQNTGNLHGDCRNHARFESV